MFKLSRNNAGDAKDVAALRAAVFDELTGLWNKTTVPVTAISAEELIPLHITAAGYTSVSAAISANIGRVRFFADADVAGLPVGEWGYIDVQWHFSLSEISWTADFHLLKLNDKRSWTIACRCGEVEADWTQLTDASGNAVKANSLGGYSAGNAVGNVPLNNYVENAGLKAQYARLLFNRVTSANDSILTKTLSDISTYGQGFNYYTIAKEDAACPWTVDAQAVFMGYSNYARLVAFKFNSKAIAIRVLSAGTWDTAWTYLTDDSGNPLHPSVATTANAANAYIGANGTTVLKSTSSRRYKTNIIDLENSDALDALRPVLYKSNPDTVPGDDPKIQHYGFIAEEVEEVAPLLVQYAENDDGEKIPDGVQYERVTVLLVKRVHELEARLKKAGI